MSSSAGRDLSYVSFEGKAPSGAQRPRSRCARSAAPAAVAPAPEERLDPFITWVLGRAGLDATAYRTPPLHRRLPACLRILKVHSTHDARTLLERKPHLIAGVVSSLLIGVTEFFREPDVFDRLRTQILSAWAGHNRSLAIWSAACSTGAELYSMAILLAESGLLRHSSLLGTDCRGDAIERATMGLYDATATRLVPSAIRDKYFEPSRRHDESRRHTPCAASAHGVCGLLTAPAHGVCGVRTASAHGACPIQWRPVEALRRQVRWKVADLVAGVEDGPWDIILWRNAAIYLKSCPAEAIWRRLASVLAPGGVLIAGKAERPPRDAGLTHVGRCIYRRLA